MHLVQRDGVRYRVEELNRSGRQRLLAATVCDESGLRRGREDLDFMAARTGVEALGRQRERPPLEQRLVIGRGGGSLYLGPGRDRRGRQEGGGRLTTELLRVCRGRSACGGRSVGCVGG